MRSWYAGLDAKKPRANSHAYGLLHAILGTAVKDGLLQANPAQIERAMNTARKREPVILTVPEVAKLAESVTPQRFKALMLISAWCGLRWGEVTELRRKDIGAGCEILTVGRAVTRGKDGYVVGTPKSGRGRTVVIPPHRNSENSATSQLARCGSIPTVFRRGRHARCEAIRSHPHARAAARDRQGHRSRLFDSARAYLHTAPMGFRRPSARRAPRCRIKRELKTEPSRAADRPELLPLVTTRSHD